MHHTARFYFEGSLNDFLRPLKRKAPLSYTFRGSPAVKDSIEALGVPHLEICQVRVNGKAAPLNYKLQDRDEVEVYPFDGREEELTAGMASFRFVLDVHLGTLARSLRMLGFDTVYDTALTDKAIAGRAEAEQRIVLTRDVGLLKHKVIPMGYWLRSQHTGEQLAEVLRRFRLAAHVQPFTRCLVCNGIIEAVAKEAVLDQLPPKTLRYFDAFYQCVACARVYWKGSHYERMEEMIRQLRTQHQV